jgi:hypothetical protein
MKTETERKQEWMHAAAVVLAGLGALVAAGGAWVFYTQQAQMQASSMWPLPGLVLLAWAALGLVVFFSAYFSRGIAVSAWQRRGWTAIGALAALAVLGVFSIAPLVLLSLLFSLTAMILLAVQSPAAWHEVLTAVMLGAVVCVAVLLLASVVG